MKLAITTHRLIKGDGQARVNYEIARAALNRGHEITLLARVVAPELQAYPNLTWVPVPWPKVPSQLLKNLIFARRSACWLRQHGHDLSIIHLNGFVTWTPGHINTAHFVHGAWLRSPMRTEGRTFGANSLYQWLYTFLNARWERRAYQQSQIVVAVSERVRNELISIGISADRVRIIYNGVDPEEFCPGPTDRQALGLPERVLLALFVGDIRTLLKNLDTILKAMAGLSDIHLAVVGDTHRSPFPEMAERLGLSHRVHFLGFRRDIAQIMRAADLFVFPSRSETFSLVLLEAMASGLPVITASTVGAAELVTTEAGMIMPDANDAQALAAMLRALADNPALRSRMGCAGRAIAEQNTWAHMAEAYLRLYSEVARENRSPDLRRAER